MSSLSRYVTSKLSVRLSLMVVLMVALILSAAMMVMLHFSRKAVKQEALLNAQQTLEGTMLQIDNILLAVEQAAGNVYWNLLPETGRPDRMYAYSRKLLETCPYITGSAIALEPYYYKERGKYFMAYYHREVTGNSDSPIKQDSIFGNRPYDEQEWYTRPVETGRAAWIGPLKNSDAEDEALASFCLPIYTMKGERIGVLAVDVALSQLSGIVHAAKPSPNSYCTLLGKDGSYIVHPDTSKLQHMSITNILQQGVDTTFKEVAQAMLSGQTGYKQFRNNGSDYYVFYKPFVRNNVPGRTTEDLGWSVGIIYPEDDILGDYNLLLYTVIAVTILGLILLLILCQTITYRQLLPLRLLTKLTQRIAEGHYDEAIPDTRQNDEIGRLQEHFQQMQRSLATHVGLLQQLNETQKQRGENLSKAYNQAQEADRMKTAFLHNMTNQMMDPAGSIMQSVDHIHDMGNRLEPEETDRLVADIQQQGLAITELLNNMLRTSQDTETKGGEA